MRFLAWLQHNDVKPADFARPEPAADTAKFNTKFQTL